MKHVTEEPIPPRKRDPSVPEAMEALVMGLLAKDPEDRCGSAFELAEDLRRARAGLPPAFFARAALYPETPREFASTEGRAHPDSPERAPTRRPVAIGLVALAALLALLGAFGRDLTGAREGSKVPVGTVTTTQGAREGGGPAAPEGSREGGTGKGVGSGMPSVDLADGGYAPASSSAPPPASASASASALASASPSASAPASASAAPQARASQPVPSGPSGAAPSASSTASGDPSGSGGQDAGTPSTVVVQSAAQEQYR